MSIAGRDACIAALREAGLKITPQRMAVVECLIGDVTHPTANALYERLRERFPSMSVATIYNTLSALDEIGRCRRLDLGGASRFDPNVQPHDHALCERCGAMRDIDRPAEPAQPALQALPGFMVERVERIYRGVCAECAEPA
jgi:Fur family peroxide stress response transcriptional regulator